MTRLLPPPKSAVLALEPHVGLGLEDILVPCGGDEFARVWSELSGHRHLGFDTESKPTFVKGQGSGGPDVVQFATPTRAYVLQLRDTNCADLARAVLTAPDIVKVGFGLQQDRALLRQRLGVEVHPSLDLDRVFHGRGYPRSIGIKAAVAVVFGRRFVKSKRITTTNWALPRLEARQLLYAANDAYVALQVWQALKLEDGGRCD
jgi:ribonuclease D